MISSFEWYQIKLFIEHGTGIEMAALHVIAGVLIQLAAALLLRIPVARWAPWLVILAFELVNEFSDLRLDQWPDASSQYGEGVKDLIATMILPTVIMLAARFRPGLFVRRKSRND